MKNILLFSLSLVNSKAKETEYYYQYQDSDGNLKEPEIKGYMTNEAPTKSLIEKLAASNEQIDEIVLLCSKKSKEAVKVDPPYSIKKLLQDSVETRSDGATVAKCEVSGVQNHISDLRFEDGLAAENVTHIEFYRRQIEAYLRENHHGLYEADQISITSIDVDDYIEEAQIAEKAIEVARTITSSGEKVRLYMDFNGGQRNMAFMLLSVSKLMKLRNIETAAVFSMNFENKKNKKVIVQEMPAIFSSVDLVSAINEYINYGRINGLRTYFSSVEDTQIQDILSQMQEFAENLQLCRTGYIMVKRGKLLAALEEYIRQHQESTDAYDILFEYVVEDILKGYEGLLNGSLPDVIQWCVEKEFVQQALTFCTELLPGYFWEQEIFAPTEEEREQYKKFLDLYLKVYKKKVKENAPKDDLRDKAKTAAKSLRSSYRNEMSENSYSYRYNWMTSYLKWTTDREHRYETIYAYMNQDVPAVPNPGEIQKLEFDLSRIGILETDTDDAGGAKECMSLLPMQEHAASRAYSKLGGIYNMQESKLKEILAAYHLLKQQRNKANHASENGNNWSYSRLCNVMSGLVEYLRALENNK